MEPRKQVGAGVKSTGAGGPEFESPRLCGSSHPPLTADPGEPNDPFWPLWVHSAQYIDIVQAKLPHT